MDWEGGHLGSHGSRVGRHPDCGSGDGCRWDTEAEEGGGTCQSLYSKVVTDLDVLSPTVRPSPSLLHHRGP